METPNKVDFIRIDLTSDGLTLVVPDGSNPLWSGNYYRGKLHIYATTQVHPEWMSNTRKSELLKEAFFVCVLTGTAKDSDFLFLTSYLITTSPKEVIGSLIGLLYEEYTKQLIARNPASVALHSTAIN